MVGVEGVAQPEAVGEEGGAEQDGELPKNREGCGPKSDIGAQQNHVHEDDAMTQGGVAAAQNLPDRLADPAAFLPRCIILSAARV